MSVFKVQWLRPRNRGKLNRFLRNREQRLHRRQRRIHSRRHNQLHAHSQRHNQLHARNRRLRRALCPDC